MSKHHFSVTQFQAHWNSLSKEQRSPGGDEIILSFSAAEIHMEIASKNGSTVAMPWFYGTDELGANLLLQILQYSGIPVGDPADYWLDEAEPEAASTTAEEPEQEQEPEQEPEPEPEPEQEQSTEWVNYKPEDSTAKKIGIALVKTATLVGTVYLAYRMSRRPTFGPIRF